MAEFQEVMRQWRRMCLSFKSCSDCPMMDEDGSAHILCSEGGIQSAVPEVQEDVIIKWAAEHPESVYPSFAKYLEQFGIIIRRDGAVEADFFKAHESMSADIAQKLGIEPKEER